MPRGAVLYKKDPLSTRGALSRALVKGKGRVLRAVADTLPSSVVFQHGLRKARRIALTFDDGPGPMTEALVETLAKAGALATFFVIGDECASYTRELAAMARAGHDVAGHGWSHTRFSQLPKGALESELARTEALLPDSPARRMVRPPFGTMTPRSLLRTFRAGYASAMWSFDPLDYTLPTAAEVVRAVDPGELVNGDIVLLHEERRATLEALPEMIDRLRGAGFELVTVTQILR